MVTSDFTQTQILGKPSEYFTEKILPGSKFHNCSLSVAEIKDEIKNILENAKTNNGVIAIKIMSDYIIEIAKAIESIKIAEELEEIGEGVLANSIASSFKGQERKTYLQKLFIDFFNSLDMDGQFAAVRVYRQDKVKQAASRFIAARTGLYHVWKNERGQLVNHYDRPSKKATPFILNLDKVYDYSKITSIVNSIYQEERELDIMFENFRISPTILIYENIVKGTDYLQSIISNLAIHNPAQDLSAVQRKTVKTASNLNAELISKFNDDGGYKGKIEPFYSERDHKLKHIPATDNKITTNKLCSWNQDIVDVAIDAPYLKQSNSNILVIEGAIISRKKIARVFVSEPISGKNHEAEINLDSKYFGSVYWGIDNSSKSRFRCLILLSDLSLVEESHSQLELNYQIESSFPVNLMQVDVSDFVSKTCQTI